MAWMGDVFTKLFHNAAAIGGAVNEMITPALPIWIAFVVGLFIGWAWRPRWANLDRDKFCSLMARIAVFSAPSSPCKNLSAQTLNPLIESCSNNLLEDRPVDGSEALFSSYPKSGGVRNRSLKSRVPDHPLVNEEDLIHLAKLVEVKDGGPSWIPMMDRSTSTMAYRAWRRDSPNGLPQYRSSTIFEDAAPETVRDFFWDDEFRLTNKWDDMLIHSKTLEECSTTGTMMVQWIRKFPFFCSDREYIIGRRIWESGRTYYCVTKGVPCTSIPRNDKPRRVDLYYSSWCIRPVESRRGDGQMTSCEVLLFHHEDMGIPWEIAKLGVRQGMWGAVKKIEPGLRAYQKAIASGNPLSRPACIAHNLCTNVSPELLSTLLNGDADGVGDASSSGVDKEVGPPEKQGGVNVPKIILICGAVALACSLDRGLLTKAVIFGAARRFGRIGGRVR